MLKSEYKHNIVIAAHNWITIHISLPFPAPCGLFQDVWHPQSQGSNAQVEASSSVLLFEVHFIDHSVFILCAKPRILFPHADLAHSRRHSPGFDYLREKITVSADPLN